MRLTTTLPLPAQHELEHQHLEYENTDVEDIFRRVNFHNAVPEDEREVCETWVREMMKEFSGKAEGEEVNVNKVFLRLMKSRSLKSQPRKSHLLSMYLELIRRGELEYLPKLHKALVTRPSKSLSGVLTITVLTSPYPGVIDLKTGETKVSNFSCKWNCYYCPSEPGQPKSYLRDEPAVLRANENRWDPVLQFCDRLATLTENGHPPDKIELLILGGTWSSYPIDYQETFIRDLFYAANTFWERDSDDLGKRRRQERLSLLEEEKINETAAVKIIGITLETRPDCITKEELRRFRYYGCTRVQLGLQHTNDDILALVNRECTTEEAKRAIALLKDACFKVDIHLMPNLPGSTPELDKEMFHLVTNDEDLQADQWKIYPCEITPWTVIKKWFDEGKYVPYSNTELMDVVIDAKANTKPWVRLNRILRDIPTQYQLIPEHVLRTDWREEVVLEMKRRNLECRCIRCREIRGKTFDVSLVELKVQEYRASRGGREFFISFEIEAQKSLIGFCRLRLPPEVEEEDEEEDAVFPSLKGCALIRELHVYGKLRLVQSQKASSSPDEQYFAQEGADGKRPKTQHLGYGGRLLAEAERIARTEGFQRLAVISGVGVKNYYRKHGFVDSPNDIGHFLIKPLVQIQQEQERRGMGGEPAAVAAVDTATTFALVFGILYFLLTSWLTSWDDDDSITIPTTISASS